MRGRIRWFDARRGYGFIIPEAGGEDVFVHRRVLQETAHLRRLLPGQIVEYEVVETSQGTKATRVTIVPTSSSGPSETE